eukprot:4448246-Pyramimonas_sp.AAC.1
MGPPRSQMWTQAAQNLRPVCFATYTATTGTWTMNADAWARIVAAPRLRCPWTRCFRRSQRLLRGLRMDSWNLDQGGAANFGCAEIRMWWARCVPGNSIPCATRF